MSPQWGSRKKKTKFPRGEAQTNVNTLIGVEKAETGNTLRGDEGTNGVSRKQLRALFSGVLLLRGLNERIS